MSFKQSLPISLGWSGGKEARAALPRVILLALRLAILLTLVIACLPGMVHAQSGSEQQKKTRYFDILYPAANESDATHYAGFVDDVYDQIATIFHYQPPTPLTLRLYGSLDDYYRVNPLAEQLTGVIAHSAVDKHEISIALPRTRGLDQEAVVNNVRHELTHVVIADLSGNKLPTGFHEGIAQYAERPGHETQASISLLRQAKETNRLLSWQELNQRGKAYNDPQVAYPESLSVVSFLVDSYGFPNLLKLIAAFKTSNGYRGALESTYGAGADALEAQWQETLPDYLDGRWRLNALYSFDLSRAESLVAQGAYSAAQTELSNAIELLKSTEQPETLSAAQELLAKTQRGLEASAVAVKARAALERSDYPEAARLATAAKAIYAELANSQRNDELKTYQDRANQGQAAQKQLADAERLIGQLQLTRAAELARQAGETFKALGDESRAARSSALLSQIEVFKRQAGYGLLGLAGLGMGLSALRRLFSRRSTATLTAANLENLI